MSGSCACAQKFLSVLCAGAFAALIVSLLCLNGSSCSELCTAIYLVILCVTSVVSCVLAFRFVFEARRGAFPSVDNRIKQFNPRSTSRHSICSDPAFCPICLCALSSSTEIYQTRCCSNGIHLSCLRKYVQSYRDSFLVLPPCCLCRSSSITFV
jgi:hypothetical protein